MSAKKIKTIMAIVILLLGAAGVVLGVFEIIKKQSALASQQPTGKNFTGTKIAAYYFHKAGRCASCTKIGSTADTTIKKDFAQQLKNGTLEWKFVDYEAPENNHFQKTFDLAGPTLVVMEIKDDQLNEKNWRRLDEMWNLRHDTPALEAYFQDQVAAMLAGTEAQSETRGFWVLLLLVFGLGISTSISPCPLATNIAAVSFIGKQVDSKTGVLWSGFMYSVGRAAVYIALAAIILAGLFKGSAISDFLKQYLNVLVGPLLLLVAPLILGWIGGRFTFTIGSDKLHQRFAKAGGLGALMLGVLFALSFCPISAGIFFGPFLLAAAEAKSSMLFPAVYGIATGLPVFGFALVIAFASNYLGKTFHHLTEFEKWARLITGVIFILIGIYLTLNYTLGIPI
ncbi:MAG: sulfite exporter TauE/SafE family protein [Phycisphaerae bacterium]|nr:sulfite exporter TauE/SafE family protein [Phycisphaerae bacterium]